MDAKWNPVGGGRRDGDRCGRYREGRGSASWPSRQAGGPAGILKKAVKNALPFGGDNDDDDGDSGVRGIGEGRRTPVQQSIDVAVPIETAYNRVKRVSQEDETTVLFTTKIWGKSKEFKANIVTARPDQKIKWEVTEGNNRDSNCRLISNPAACSKRPRAARGDLHRFKAYIEAIEEATGSWRGTIEDGKVVRKREPRGRSQNGSSGRSRASSGRERSSSRSRSRGH